MSKLSFSELGLDPRVLRALAKKGFSAPTPVQAEAVAKALEGKDIVARARTGSGKTMAYLLPAIHRLLSNESAGSSFQAVVLVPTKELCEQVRGEANSITVHCGADIRVTALGNETTDHARRIAVANAGQLVITTPGRFAAAIKDGTLTSAYIQEHLQVLVLDEADLLLSYGYEDDLRVLAPAVPRSCQCVLMSATTSSDVDRLSKLVLYNPVTLDLSHLSTTPGGGSAPAVEHHAMHVAPADRLLAVMAMLRLNLLKRKVLMFVNGVDTAYRLRLFLEAFGQKAAVLNEQMPLNSRHHIIQQFNKDLFDHLIATDGTHAAGRDAQAERADSGAGASTSGKARRKGAGKGAGKGARDAAGGEPDDGESGVTRGIDFKGVRTVLNVELPGSLQGYTHRVGRTGRAGATGIAVTLFTDADAAFRSSLEEHLASKPEEGQGAEPPGEAAGTLKDFQRLKPEAIQALRYRAEDVLRSLTKAVVREARAKDLKFEILNSSRLQEYFETHEADAYVLKHDKQLAKDPQRSRHLRQLPDYLKEAAGLKQGKTAARRGVKRKVRPEDDPIRGKVHFQKDEELTDMEKKALKVAKKAQRKKEKEAPKPAVLKKNVRKRR